jgi:hypothetical protein
MPEQQPQIYKALIAAQKRIGNVTKSAENSFFKDARGKPSKFVDLATLNDAVFPALHENGLTLIQRLVDTDSGTAVSTQIFHESGETLPESFYPVVTKDKSDPQKFGGGVTYARRYSIMAYLGIAAEDDDGNLAAKEPEKPKSVKPALARKLKDTGVDTAEKFQALAKARGLNVTSTASLTEAQASEWLQSLDGPDVPY